MSLFEEFGGPIVSQNALPDGGYGGLRCRFLSTGPKTIQLPVRGGSNEQEIFNFDRGGLCCLVERFGIAVALLAPIPMFMIYYVVQQKSAALAIRQSIGDGVVVIVVALVAAFLNRRSA